MHLPGGTLFITLHRDNVNSEAMSYAEVTMRGPAAFVFEAEVDTAGLVTRRAEHT